MEDSRYPGMDVNPIAPSYEYEYLQSGTFIKLFEAGFSRIEDMRGVPVGEIARSAALTDDEAREVREFLERFA